MSKSPTPPPSRPYLNAVDRTARGMGRYELTSFFATPGAVKGFVRDMSSHFAAKMNEIDAVVGIDALGFPLSAAVAFAWDKPLILARKGGKLALPPAEKLTTEQFDDYTVHKGLDGAGGKSLEVRRDLVKPGMGVVIIDEWIDTGAQMTATAKMFVSAGARVLGLGTLQLREGKGDLADKLYETYDVFAANRE